ncbi:hypothetical protein SAMN05192561_1037 [Halopenitus malekzadehii]|uniref:Small CPxCG-related zinc finger protein n=1 Tax=Halopenitus malekzadehii TaxID=1267564 RepID=A0A1H6IN94_9EURY|nr:hypothetical protein [Halopenitus malekzadehii]SEH48932.1 hypothetical protein SAMN05192561_1037 [Halopenitus malekzadehii]
MATEACAVCDTDVRIAGGIGDLWSFAFESTQGLTLELVDGSEFFLCFDCLERLPDDTEPTAADVERLQAAAETDAGTAADGTETDVPSK